MRSDDCSREEREDTAPPAKRRKKSTEQEFEEYKNEVEKLLKQIISFEKDYEKPFFSGENHFRFDRVKRLGVKIDTKTKRTTTFTFSTGKYSVDSIE